MNCDLSLLKLWLFLTKIAIFLRLLLTTPFTEDGNLQLIASKYFLTKMQLFNKKKKMKQIKLLLYSESHTHTNIHITAEMIFFIELLYKHQTYAAS